MVKRTLPQQEVSVRLSSKTTHAHLHVKNTTGEIEQILEPKQETHIVESTLYDVVGSRSRQSQTENTQELSQ